jgi:hypothetical protein
LRVGDTSGQQGHGGEVSDSAEEPVHEATSNNVRDLWQSEMVAQLLSAIEGKNGTQRSY